MPTAHEIDYQIHGHEMQYVEVELDPGESAVAEAGSLMYKDPSVEMTTVFGDGSGQGSKATSCSCTLVEHELKAGEDDTGCLAALSQTVDYDVVTVGGVKSMMFGGEGVFFARLRGPGHVWLQSLPFSRLAGRIMANMMGRRTDEGSVLGPAGDMFRGN